jgi:hypothetical protein
LGAYRIPPETGILIPSGYVNDSRVSPLRMGALESARTCGILLRVDPVTRPRR